MQGTDYGDPNTAAVMRKELQARLAESATTGKPLKVYCGYDPRRPDLHLGHTITMRKLRQFQELGHDVTFLIGTYTSLIGQPDQDKARDLLSAAQVEENARTYAEQAFKILDRDKTQVRRNAEWLAPLNFGDLIQMASHFTVQQFLARDNFRKRLDAGDPIYLHETFYSLMQAYDAVAQETDVQIGGADQLFNIVVAGRKLQESMGQRPMIAIIVGESLPGTDGVQKMSKSLGNHIPLLATPEDMYGKIMSVPDLAMLAYHKLLLGWGGEQLTQLARNLQTRPKEVKMALAREIVTIFIGEEAAVRGEEHFVTVFVSKDDKAVPDDIPEITVTSDNTSLIDLISQAGLVASKGEGRRLIEQGGIRVDGSTVSGFDHRIRLSAGHSAVIKVGKRKFLRVRRE